MDSIVEDYGDDGGDDDDCRGQGFDADDEWRVRSYWYHSSSVQLILRYCIVFGDVAWKKELAWNWDQMVRNFDPEYDAYWESDGTLEQRDRQLIV